MTWVVSSKGIRSASRANWKKFFALYWNQMASNPNILRLDHLTYRGNRKNTRYGWLRLTPAFSLHLVQGMIQRLPRSARVLDPFCGTGTTALVCAEEGIECESTDINLFLLWLAEAKCTAYSSDDLEQARIGSNHVTASLRSKDASKSWIPQIHQIDKWWEPSVLEKLAKMRGIIEEQSQRLGVHAVALLKVAFCRAMIDMAKVSFAHQSMSFKRPGPTLLFDFKGDDSETAINKWELTTRAIFDAAQTKILARPRFIHCDARDLSAELANDSFDCVITSPPYPNRMSYIRELRPYMYWLGYLTNGKDAGELDWEAIGGTRGCATSNLTRWRPPKEITVPYSEFNSILSRIAVRSALLSQYVHKYFCDMATHVKALFKVVRPQGSVHYVVGNSKFYDVLLPVQDIFASLFSAAGFVDMRVEIIRKRTSKKELFEYVVTARKPR